LTGTTPVVPLVVRERADAARNRRAILAAATELYETADDPSMVTMDDVAAAAGVGKGTLFRRFGDRAGLLRALFETRIEALTDAIESGPPPLGPSTPARARIVAILDAIVAVKLQNRRLTLALERSDGPSTGSTLFAAPLYAPVHALLAELLVDVVGADGSIWTAHALLSATRVDLIDHLLMVDGWSGGRVRRQLELFVRRVLGPEPA
jgi:AcrR family transcriptional regulator